jgi:thymidylate synthase ThyX
MAYKANVLCDSMTSNGVRLTSIEVTFPRMVLAEFNTHRMFSRNSASSRAIPVEKQIKRVLEDPFIPEYWGKNQKGMQAEQELEGEERESAIRSWLAARDQAVARAQELLKLEVHKQITNRLLEPFMWHTVIVTATEWSNFDALRRHKDAQPEIKKAADLMWDARKNSFSTFVSNDEYHLPLVAPSEARELKVQGFDLRLVSVGRCARVSYLTHDGKRDPQADVDLANRLKASGHMSPYEHVARPMTREEYDTSVSGFSGNFRGWIQFRKTLPFEYDYSLIPQ